MLYDHEKLLEIIVPDYKFYFFSRTMLGHYAGAAFGIALFTGFVCLEAQGFEIRSAYFIPLFVFLFFLPKIILRVVNYRKTLYAFSNERIFFSQGVFTKNIFAFDFNKINTIAHDHLNAAAINPPADMRFYLKYSEKVDNDYEAVVYTWLAVPDCREVAQRLTNLMNAYKAKHGDEFVPNDEERVMIEIQQTMNRIEKLVAQIDKEDEFETMVQGSDKSDFPEEVEWRTCDICGYEAVATNSEACEICFSGSFEKENEEGEYANQQAWLVGEQLFYFSDVEEKQNVFYKPKMLRGFKKSERWKPSITYEMLLKYRKADNLE